MNLATKAIAALTLTLSTLISGASADTYQHIDDLASDIARQSGRLVESLQFCRHSTEYRHLVQDARQMRNMAEHLHDVAHHHGPLSRMEQDLAQLDRVFRHFESLFRQVDRNPVYGRVQSPSRSASARIWELLHAIEDDILRLQDDLRTLRVPTCPLETSPPEIRTTTQRFTTGRPSYTVNRPMGWGHPAFHPHRAYDRGRSFTIGGGSSQFTFRF